MESAHACGVSTLNTSISIQSVEDIVSGYLFKEVDTFSREVKRGNHQRIGAYSRHLGKPTAICYGRYIFTSGPAGVSLCDCRDRRYCWCGKGEAEPSPGTPRKLMRTARWSCRKLPSPRGVSTWSVLCTPADLTGLFAVRFSRSADCKSLSEPACLVLALHACGSFALR